MIYKHFVFFAISLCSLSANAALFDRGNGLIYDDILNITWLQDANYAYTSGYSINNAIGSWGDGTSNIQASGAMGWAAAHEWADQLVYQGYDNWRIASVGSAPSAGVNQVTGELGHMFYYNLGNVSYLDSNCENNCLLNVSFVDTYSGDLLSFSNIQNSVYWYNECGQSCADHGWSFQMNIGYTNDSHGQMFNSLYVWAVADGDIAAIPSPSTVYLLFLALIPLLVLNFKKYQSVPLMSYS